MDIYLHKFKIDAEWLKNINVSVFTLNKEAAAFFKEHINEDYSKSFKIKSISPFLYDEFNEIDYISFEHKALVGEKPICYGEEEIIDFQFGIEKMITEILTLSLKEKWVECSKEWESIFEIQIIPLSELEDFYKKKIIEIRVAKRFIKTPINNKVAEKILEDFMEEYLELFRKMPNKFYLSRNGSKTEVVSEIVKIEEEETFEEKNRFFCYVQELKVTQEKNEYYLGLFHSLRKVLLGFRNEEDEIVFFKQNRTLFFTRNAENGISVSNLKLDKNVRKILRFEDSKSEDFAMYNGLKENVEDFSYNPLKYLSGDILIYLSYQQKDINKMDENKENMIQSGASMVERFFVYVLYRAKVSTLISVNENIEEIKLKWKVNKEAPGYRTLTFLPNSKKKLSDLGEFNLGIVYENEKAYEEVKKLFYAAFVELSKEPEDAKNDYILLTEIGDNLYNVMDMPNNKVIFRLKIHFIPWQKELFGSLTDKEINNKSLRVKKIDHWAKENHNLSAAIIGIENYDSSKIADRDPKRIIRNVLTKNIIISQFFHHKENGKLKKDAFKNGISDVFSRIGAVQNIFLKKQENVLKDMLFFNIKEKNKKYYLFISQVTDQQLGILINKNTTLYEIQDLFLEVDLVKELKEGLDKEELKNRISALNNLTQGKVWVYPQRYLEFTERKVNLISYKEGESIGVTIKGKSKGNVSVSRAPKAFQFNIGEVYLLPNKLDTDKNRISDTMRLTTNYKPFTMRTKLLLNLERDLYKYIDPLHFLMYINAQFSSSTNLPYPLHVNKYLEEITESID